MNKKYLKPALNPEKQGHPPQKKPALFRIVVFLIFFLALTGISLEGWGQTNPTTGTLPYSFTGAATIPSTMAIHRFGTTAGAIPTSRITTDGNADLPSTTTNNSGGYMIEGAGGVDGVSLLASSSQSAGAIVVEVSTSGKTGITVSWVSWTKLDQTTYTMSMALQYRVGESGAWINVDSPSSSVYSTNATIGRANFTSYTQTLPVGAENQAIIQLRWLYWASAGSSGSRDRLGIDEISITGTSACTPPSAPTSVTPGSGLGVCNGSSTNLNATSAGNNINWYTTASGGTKIGSSASGVNYAVSPAANTTYYAEAEVSAGCVSATRTATALITVNALPTAAPAFSANPICSGASTTLSANASAGSGTISTYAWSSGIAGNNASGSVSAAGTYTVTVTNSNSCSASATSASLSLNPLPNVTTFSASGAATCTGSGGVITVSSSSLTTGNYTVTYNVSGTNTVGSTTATMSFTAGSPGTGTFTTSALSAAGASNVANITAIAFTATPVCTISLSSSTAAFTTSTCSVLSASALTAFGTVCTNASPFPTNTFTITGTALTSANLTVAALTGYSYSTDNSTFSSSLSLSQGGGSYSQLIYVKFTPVASATYIGNIVVGGGGASSVNCAADGTGVLAVTQAVTSSAATSIVNTTATLNGNVTTMGVCPATTERGFVYSATATNNNPLVGGSGVTKNVVAGIAPGAYTLGLTGLTANTGYSFKAYLYDGSTYTYGNVTTFTTLAAASKLAFGISPPATGTVSNYITPFTVEAQRADNFVDAEYTGNITIAKTSGSGNISGTLTVTAVAGVATFNAIQFDAADTYTITASSGALTTVTSGNIVIISGPCFSEDFSSIATGDNTTTIGSGTAWSGNSNFPTVSAAYQAGGAVKLGSSGSAGSITSASLTGVSGDVTVSFDVKGWTTVEGDIKVTLNGLTQTVTYTAVMGGSFENKSVIFTSVPSGSTLKIETSAKRAFIDNVILTCAAACTPPSTQATSMTFSSVGTTTMIVGWSRGTTPGDAVLTIGKSGSAASDPTIGTAYSGNSTFGSGTPCGSGSAVFSSSGTSVSVINLTAETQYYFNAYEYFSATNCYAIPALSGNRYTLSVEPTSQPTSGLSATTCASNSIDLTVPAPSTGADGYIVLQKSGSAPTGLPADASAYTVGNTIGDATVAAIVTSSGTITIPGLSASTNYYFQLIPYNANSALVAQTYNYLTTGTLLQTSFTTLSASASAASTIETDGTYAYTQNIAYATFQTTPVPASATNSVGVHNIIIKDGGATTDADLLPTMLTAISYTYTGTSNTIRAAALFTTTGSKVADGTIGSNSISFSGLTGANVTASDGGTVQLILRVTFNSTVTDNDKLVFTVSSVSGGNACNYSQFVSGNGGGAQSDNNSGNDKNRIEVTADRLAFNPQPLGGSVNTNMPPFTVKAVDVNGNTDLDASKTITLSTSGTGMTSSPSYTITSGAVSITDVQYSSVQTNITLTANTTGYTVNSITSNQFNIDDVPIGTYRTLTGGTWPSGTATWERFTASGWISATPAANTTSLMIIKHSITTSAAFAASSPYTSMIVSNGGSFTDGHNSTFGSLLIENGGVFTVNDPSVDINSTGTLTVESGGTLVLNSSTLNHADGLFDGTENFKDGSTVEIRKYDNNTSPGEDDLIDSYSPISTNALGYYFGNLYINFTNENSKAFTLIGIIGSQKLCSGNLTIANQTASHQVQLTNVNANVEIGGNVIVTKNNFAFGTVGSSNLTHTVKGNIQINGADALIDLNPTSSGSASVLVNLEGDLIGTAGTIKSADDGCGIAFTNTTMQNINVADAVPFNNINCYVRGGATVQLYDNNLKLNSNSTFTVENGGTLNFNWDTDNATPLMIVNGASGSNLFTSLDGSVLKITHLSGLVKNTANAGNVQLSVSNKTFSQLATFWYIGKADQVTGDAVSTGSTGKQLIVDLANNLLQLRPSNNLAFSNSTTISSTGGKLDIRKGQFIESESEHVISCAGTLYMAPGTLYKIVKGNSAYTDADDIPRMSGVGAGSFPYVLNGGTIELAGSGANNAFQRLRSDNASYNYIKVKFSGGNTYLSDYKNLSSQTEVDSAVIITGTAVVDCFTGGSGVAASFIGNGGLIMDGGRMRIKKLNDANPELSGINMPYSLTGGTIEFYGSDAAQQQLIRGAYGSPSTKISYYNIDINAGAANYDVADPGNVNMSSSFLLKGALNVFSPAVFRMDETDIIEDAALPSNSITINSGAGLLYGNPYGIKTSGTGVNDGNIRISGIRSFSNGASYGFISNGNMASGNGLPASVNGLYVYKTNSSDKVTLTNTVKADNLLKMLKGHIITGTNMVELGASTVQTGTLEYTEGYVVGNMRRWFNGVNSGSASGLFPMGENVSGTIKNRKYLIEFSDAPASGGYLDVYFNNVDMGYDGLPISGIPVAGACSGFDVTTTEDQGYWVASPETGKLSDGTYKLSITGEGFVTINDLCKLTLLKRVGAGNWTTPGTHLEPTGTTSVPTVSRSGITGFSNFGFGGGSANPLPIELLAFSADCDQNSVKLEWTTATETNNDYFTVERSADTQNWSFVGKVPGAGNSNSRINYSFTDKNALNGNSYYRLKQTDFDGKNETFSPIAVTCGEHNDKNNISFYPNPFTSEIIVDLENVHFEQALIRIYDVFGKKVFEKTLNNADAEIKKTGINLESLSPGVYTVEFTSESFSNVAKIVKSN